MCCSLRQVPAEARAVSTGFGATLMQQDDSPAVFQMPRPRVAPVAWSPADLSAVATQRADADDAAAAPTLPYAGTDYDALCATLLTRCTLA